MLVYERRFVRQQSVDPLGHVGADVPTIRIPSALPVKPPCCARHAATVRKRVTGSSAGDAERSEVRWRIGGGPDGQSGSVRSGSAEQLVDRFAQAAARVLLLTVVHGGDVDDQPDAELAVGVRFYDRDWLSVGAFDAVDNL